MDSEYTIRGGVTKMRELRGYDAVRRRRAYVTGVRLGSPANGVAPR
jgi:hypothetical protein